MPVAGPRGVSAAATGGVAAGAAVSVSPGLLRVADRGVSPRWPA